MAHIHEKFDFTVEVFIVFEDKVLLRLHDKRNVWLSVGGHVELNEDPNQAALREVKEEVGLNIKLYEGNKLFNLETDRYKELIPPYFMNVHLIGDVHKHIAMTYFAYADNMDVRVENDSDKSTDWKWVTKSEIKNMENLGEDIRFYGLKALELLSN